MTAIVAVTMPKFGLAMTEGKVAAWTKGEGAPIAAGDEIADIETTKITMLTRAPLPAYSVAMWRRNRRNSRSAH